MIANYEEGTASDQSNNYSDAKGTFYQNGIVQEIALSLYKYNTWIYIAGISLIFSGTALAITLVGLIIAWIPIWMGIILFSVAKNIKIATHTGETIILDSAISRLNLYFKILGVLLMLSIVVYGFIMIGGIAVFSSIL